jgi:hypothetical protein
MSDDTLEKPVNAADCKRVIDDLIMNKMTPTYYWGSIKQILERHGISQNKIKKIEHVICVSSTNKNSEEVREILAKYVDDAKIVVTIIKTFCKLLSLIP